MAEQHILGDSDWRDRFTFHMLSEEDCTRIMEHIAEHFAKAEPMTVFLGAQHPDEPRQKDYEGRIRFILRSGLSFCVVDKHTQEVINSWQKGMESLRAFLNTLVSRWLRSI